MGRAPLYAGPIGAIEDEAMSQIEELERRITAAMDRISKGVAAISSTPVEPVAPAEPAAPVVDPEEMIALKAALDDERTVTAQLEERIKSLREKDDAKAAERDTLAAKSREMMEKLDGEMQRMRAANEQLRSSNDALRAANEAGVGEPHLINKAMLAELEALRAGRAVDAAEAGAIMGAIGSLMNGAGDASLDENNEEAG